MPPRAARSCGHASRSSAIEPALGLLELDSIAAGIAAGDAMAKRAPIEVIRAGTVHPGRYLVLVGGAVADVEEALEAGREVAAASIRDVVFLPNVHPGVVAGMRGVRREATLRRWASSRRTPLPATIRAADAGLKGARVAAPGAAAGRRPGRQGLPALRRPGLGGGGGRRGSASGLSERPPGLTWRVIAQLHAEMAENLAADARFAARVRE